MVDANKGFSYLSHDNSFVCQKKNHFQVTVHVGVNPQSAEPRFVYNGQTDIAETIDGFYIHLHGIKVSARSA